MPPGRPPRPPLPSPFPAGKFNPQSISVLCNAHTIQQEANFRGFELCLPLKIPLIDRPYDFTNKKLDTAYTAETIKNLAETEVSEFTLKLEKLLLLEVYPDTMRITCIVMMAQYCRHGVNDAPLNLIKAMMYYAVCHDILIAHPCVKGLRFDTMIKPHGEPLKKGASIGSTELRVKSSNGVTNVKPHRVGTNGQWST